jgi:hypothetical protein
MWIDEIFISNLFALLQGCNDEWHAFGRLSLLRGITPIFFGLKHIGLSSPLY